MHSTFDAVAVRRIGEAVREVEGASAAEIVVEIRARSGSYAHADARFAALLAFLSLLLIVFMPWTVPPVAVLLAPAAFFFLGIGLARGSAGMRRLLTTSRERTDEVHTRAAALFHDAGIANTSGETGVLLYVSVLERRMEVLADRGVLRAVRAEDWNAALERIQAIGNLDADGVIDAIRTLGGVLAASLPAAASDVDELSSVPRIHR